MSATHTCFYLHTADTVAPKQRATPKMVPLVAEKEVEAKEAIEAAAVPPLRKKNNFASQDIRANLKPQTCTSRASSTFAVPQRPLGCCPQR
jgi:hypothetical protein